MSDPTHLQAIRVLEDGAAEIRRKAEAEASELELSAKELRSKYNLPAVDTKPTISKHGHAKAGYSIDFRGMTIAAALELFVRVNAGKRLGIAEIVRELSAGGCFLGDEENRWARNVMAAARGRKRVFGYDRDKRLVWLAETAYQAPPTRTQKEKGRTPKHSPERVSRRAG